MVQRGTVLEHSRIVSSTEKNVGAVDAHPVVLKNSTEHAEPLFIAVLDQWTSFDTRKKSLGVIDLKLIIIYLQS